MKYTGPRCGIWDIQYLISEMTPYNVSLHATLYTLNTYHSILCHLVPHIGVYFSQLF